MRIKFFVFLFFLACLISCSQNNKKFSTWKIYRGNAESNAYSALNQINTKNVQQLKVAWVYHTHDSGFSIDRMKWQVQHFTYFRLLYADNICGFNILPL